MITWMQRHKKWLVITIWISTIAFVGAGFVGWGSYDYGKSSGAVAVVGDRKISVEEYQREYSSLYGQYARAYGNQFNQEMAKKIGLPEAAVNLAIQKNLILSYADDLGLTVTDEDIAKELVKMPAFIKDGKFDKELYIRVLTQNGTTAVAYEKSLKRDLLLQKVESLFDINPSSNEVNNLSKLLFAQDDLSIQILDPKSIKIDYDDTILRDYWNINKIKYMSTNSYELAISKLPFVTVSPTEDELKEHYSKFKTDYKKEDGKIKSFEEAKDDMIKVLSIKATKKDALKKYLALKKDEMKFDATTVIFEDKLPFSAENINEIKTATVGDVLKPFEGTDGFSIVKLIKKIDPKPLAFAMAKDMVKADYLDIKRSEKINNIAKEAMKDFKGEHLGFVSRTSIDKIKGLNPNEAYGFLNKLFMSKDKEGRIDLGEKVVLYKINSSKLGTDTTTQEKSVKDILLRLQKEELMTSLIKNLENRYEVTSSLDNKE
ncbi:peptidylprolyl isomerase [Arcobacter sp.]|uniref:peptidylprolyl isomerase n=1 Tax=Arcobacter sp. TaxID=1872629 RepID=UPI003D0CC6A6